MTLPVDRAYFEWNIYNPFQPRRELEATFFFRSFRDRAMKVVLEPMDRNINSWKISFALAPSFRFTGNRGVDCPNKVVIFIKTGSNLVTRKQVPTNHFCKDNRWTYRFQKKVLMIPAPTLQHFQIRIDFDFPDRERLNEYFFNDDDLRSLALNMLRLLRNRRNNMNPNRVLWSENDNQAFRVHSYIMYWRWNTLFTQHPGRDDIHTNISAEVLKVILVYMYSGILLYVWDYTSFSRKLRTELCQVIDRYEIDHLYKVLVKNEAKQQRVTTNHAYTLSHLFPLEMAESRTTTNRSFVWEFNPARGFPFEDEYRATFRIQVGNEAGNWLSYSLQSRSTGQILVEVNLEVVKRLQGAPETVNCFVGQDYTVEPDQTVESGPVLFLGCPETFGGTEGNNFIRCYLRVSTGKTSESIRSKDTKAYQDRNERCQVLSDHMLRVNEQRRFAQMLVYSLEIRGEVRGCRYIHHEILRARVPQWWKGFVDGTEDRMPSFATCRLSRHALPIVFDYIYTGKLKRFDRRYLGEIDNFAALTEFHALSDWVRRYTNWLNERFS